MGVDAQVANAAPPQATATPRKASWPLTETAEVTEVPEPTSSCGREGALRCGAPRGAWQLRRVARVIGPRLTARAGATAGSSSPRTLGGGSPPGAKAGGSAAGEDSVCDATFGDLRALSDQILRCAARRLAGESSPARLTAARAGTPRACWRTSRSASGSSWSASSTCVPSASRGTGSWCARCALTCTRLRFSWPQESWPQRGDTPTTASLDKLSLGDDDVAWPGLKVSADEVTPLPFDFAAGQLDPESLFDPEMGASWLQRSWIAMPAWLCGADATRCAVQSRRAGST